MKKKALLVTTVSGFVPQFEMNNVRILRELGYEIHYASNFHNVSYGLDNHRLEGTGIICHQVDFERSPFNLKGAAKAYRQLYTLLEEQKFSLIHCHTPVGAALARLTAHRYQKMLLDKAEEEKGVSQTQLKVIYTAHGFHFYKGAPLLYWFMFYPAERFLARYTDVLITINAEDYNIAKLFCRRKKTQVKKINGVGVDTTYWSGRDLSEGERKRIRREARTELGISEKEVAFLSVGELIPRKNHQEVLQVFSKLKSEGKTNFCYIISGQGALQEELLEMIKQYDLQKQVHMLGYREDVRNLLYGADVFVFPSRQEGMPIALLEAAVAGIPLIARNIRGNREIVEAREAAELYSDMETLERLLCCAIEKGTEEQREEFELQKTLSGITTSDGRNKLEQAYDISQIEEQMRYIYKELT